MSKLKKWIREDSSLFALFLLFLAVAIGLRLAVGKSMYTPERMLLMGYQVPEFGLIALGMTFSFLLGGIDLSLVANANLSGILGAYVLSGAWFTGMPAQAVVFIGICTALFAAVAGGLLNGIMIAKFSVPPMIATLATMTFYNGIAMALTGGGSLTGFPEIFIRFGTARLAGIPVIFLIFIVVTLILGLILAKTGLGRKIYLYGENPIATRFSAIGNERLIILVFCLNGLLAGLSGLTIISRVTTAKVGYGDAYLVQAMLVAIIGGVSPSGGRGKISGVMIAIATIQVLSSAFTIWQLSPYNRKLIWGFVLIFVIFVNHLIGIRSRRKEKRAAQN
ncbi:MAG: ABC transporter permease [Eubacteriales bacterium]|nr:ABC transporter permease [Eubacteriales bacterium]